MKYRIRTDLIFESTADAQAILQYLKNQNLLGKVLNIAKEKSFFELEECHHDESPPSPCIILQHIEK